MMKIRCKLCKICIKDGPVAVHVTRRPPIGSCRVLHGTSDRETGSVLSCLIHPATVLAPVLPGVFWLSSLGSVSFLKATLCNP